MNDPLAAALEESGAVMGQAGERPEHFGDAQTELRAALDGCALCDRSHLGRVLGAGADLRDLLNRLSTADLRSLDPGAGKPTVLTTPKGRIVERLFVYHLGDPGLLLVAGERGAPRIIEHLDRFTFREETGLSDVTDSTRQLCLVGPDAEAPLRGAGFQPPAGEQARTERCEGSTVRILEGDGYGGSGFSLVTDAAAAGALWDRLHAAVRSAGGRAAGERAMEAARLLRGLPVSGAELTEEWNPLEAGLRDAISFDKGCYVGQEVVARLNTYEKVSRRLVGLRLGPGAPLPARGTELMANDRPVGKLTSAALPPGWPHPIALAYLKQKTEQDIFRLRTEDGAWHEARRVELPFPLEPGD